ncbi:general stress protein [Lacicoccus alkaliphilus]|uniref:Heat induced stress protein YflT n=1 Tax=Lacicoccus alkaliphilus DSM 16010 TaxID=1123231 RepID=A0A1M7BUW2_9BACL|nr:general stress protein [Salinicoccus alkaliphilus]SHL58656.1 Heat induced stress protein YflT [Salinicoccus alkaliphilus DSM 16010]
MNSMETFATEQQVIKRIEELKSDGVDENQITLVAAHGLEAGGAFEAYSGVEAKSSEGSAWDKIVSFFTNDQPEEKLAGRLNLTSSE